MSKMRLPESRERELEAFEEVRGQFDGFVVNGAYAVVRIKTPVSLKLPTCAVRLLFKLKPGDLIELLRTDDEENPIRIRRTAASAVSRL